jgi:hypothetical protein
MKPQYTHPDFYENTRALLKSRYNVSDRTFRCPHSKQGKLRLGIISTKIQFICVGAFCKKYSCILNSANPAKKHSVDIIDLIRLCEPHVSLAEARTIVQDDFQIEIEPDDTEYITIRLVMSPKEWGDIYATLSNLKDVPTPLIKLIDCLRDILSNGSN